MIRIINRYTTIIILVIGCCLTVTAQRRQIGEARTIIKSGKNYDKAELLMTNLLKGLRESRQQTCPRDMVVECPETI